MTCFEYVSCASAFANPHFPPETVGRNGASIMNPPVSLEMACAEYVSCASASANPHSPPGTVQGLRIQKVGHTMMKLMQHRPRFRVGVLAGDEIRFRVDGIGGEQTGGIESYSCASASANPHSPPETVQKRGVVIKKSQLSR